MATTRLDVEARLGPVQAQIKSLNKDLEATRQALKGQFKDWAAFEKEIKSASSALTTLISSTDKLSKAQQNTAQEIRGYIKSLKLVGGEVKTAEEAINDQVEAHLKLVEAAKKTAEAQVKTTKAEAKAVETVKNAGKEYERLAGIFAKLFPTLEQTRTAIERIKGELIVLRSSEAAATDEGKRAIALRQQALQILGLQASQLAELKRQTDQQTTAQDRQRRSLTRLLKKMVLWLSASASAYYLYRRLRRAVVDLVKEFVKETEEYDNLLAATEELKASLFAAFGPEIVQATGELGDATSKLSQGITEATIRAGVWAALNEEAARQLKAGTLSASEQNQALLLMRSTFRGGLLEIKSFADLLGFTAEQYEELFKAQGAVVEGLRTEFLERQKLAEITKKAESLTASLVKQVLQASDAYDEYAQEITNAQNALLAIANIQRAAVAQRPEDREAAIRLAATLDPKAAARAQNIFGQYAATIMQIEIDLQKQIDAINQQAFDRRVTLYKDYQKNIARVQRQQAKTIAANEKRFALEREFAQRRFNLSQIQSERLYLYERELLVAEGDVLAIEQLDRRYELERQAAEENFKLQQEQQKRMFELQAELLADAMRDQIQALQEALREQLRATEEERRKEIEEAKKAAQEEKALAADTQADELAELIEAEKKKLEETENARKKEIEAQGKFLAQFAKDNDLTLEEVFQAWSGYMGPDGDVYQAAKDAYDAITDATNFFMPKMKAALQAHASDIDLVTARWWAAQRAAAAYRDTASGTRGRSRSGVHAAIA